MIDPFIIDAIIILIDLNMILGGFYHWRRPQFGQLFPMLTWSTPAGWIRFSLSLFLKPQIKQHGAHLLPGFNSHLLYTPAIPIFNLSLLYKSPTFPPHHHHHSSHAPVSQVWLQPQGLLLGVRGSKAAHHIG